MSRKRFPRATNNAIPPSAGTSRTRPQSSGESSEDESTPKVTSTITPGVRSSPRLAKKSLSKLAKLQKKPKVDPRVIAEQKRHEILVTSLIYDTVYYMIVMDSKKYPIKRADIIKNVLKEEKQEFKTVILKAKDILKEIFGMKLVELEDKKGYILVIDDKSLKMGEFNENEKMSRGLLLFILTTIWMKEGSVSEEELWKALKMLGIDPDDAKPHADYGDVRKYVTQELTKQMYLVYRKINTDPPLFEFTWGPRADYEVDKEEMLDFVCEVYKNEPREWNVQYQQVNDEKKKQAQSGVRNHQGKEQQGGTGSQLEKKQEQRRVTRSQRGK